MGTAFGLFVFWERILHIAGWPWTYYIAEEDFGWIFEPPPFVQGYKEFTTSICALEIFTSLGIINIFYGIFSLKFYSFKL